MEDARDLKRRQTEPLTDRCLREAFEEAQPQDLLLAARKACDRVYPPPGATRGRGRAGGGWTVAGFRHPLADSVPDRRLRQTRARRVRHGGVRGATARLRYPRNMGLDNPVHILLLLLVLLLVFGARRLPEIGKSLGEGMRGFKDAVSGNQRDTLNQSTATQQPAPAPAPAPVETAPVEKQ